MFISYKVKRKKIENDCFDENMDNDKFEHIKELRKKNPTVNVL